MLVDAFASLLVHAHAPFICPGCSILDLKGRATLLSDQKTEKGERSDEGSVRAAMSSTSRGEGKEIQISLFFLSRAFLENILGEGFVNWCTVAFLGFDPQSGRNPALRYLVGWFKL